MCCFLLYSVSHYFCWDFKNRCKFPIQFQIVILAFQATKDFLSSSFARVSGHLTCIAWLWPEEPVDQLEPILQPMQSLDESLIPPEDITVEYDEGDNPEIREGSHGRAGITHFA